MNRPTFVVLKGGQSVLNLCHLVNKRAHEHLIINSSFIYSVARANVVIPGVGEYRFNGVAEFIVRELVEAVTNIICYNLVIRSKHQEVATLLGTVKNPDLFFSVFKVSYTVDQKKLLDMLTGNELCTMPDYTKQYVRDSLFDYVDLFNNNLVAQIYEIIRYIIQKEYVTFVELMMGIHEQLYWQAEEMFRQGELSENIRPGNLFVSYQSYDIFILNM